MCPEKTGKPGREPVCAARPLTTSRSPRWNFTKYLVDRDGRVVQRFDARVEPGSPELTGAIEDLL